MSWEQCFICEKNEHFDYQCPLESRHVNIISSNDVNSSKAVKNIHVPSEISKINEESLINFDASFIDKSHVSSANISDILDASVESSLPCQMISLFQRMNLVSQLHCICRLHLMK